MYQLLSTLTEVKPEFIFSMGRLKDDFLPPIKLLYGMDWATPTAEENETRLQNFDNLDKKLAISMLNFLIKCQKSYEHPSSLEELDKKRFKENYDSVLEYISKITDIKESYKKENSQIDWKFI